MDLHLVNNKFSSRFLHFSMRLLVILLWCFSSPFFFFFFLCLTSGCLFFFSFPLFFLFISCFVLQLISIKKKKHKKQLVNWVPFVDFCA